MRILMLTYEIKGRGGSYLRAFSLGKAIAGLGHKVTLLAASAGRATASHEHGVEIVEMPHMLPERLRHGGLDPLDLITRIRHVQRNPYDVIHSFGHRPTASIPAMMARHEHALWVADWADLWGRDGIAQTRSALAAAVVGRMDGWGERAVYGRASGLSVINQALFDEACRLGVSPECLRIIRIGCNSDLVVPQDKGAMRAKLGVPQDVPVVVYLGVATYDAGFLAESIVALVRLNPAIRMLMAGPIMSEFNRIVEAAGITEHVRHLGMVPYEQISEVLACGDVMLLPYRDTAVNRARYPNKTGDYLAAARPIVTNPTGEVGQLIEHEAVGVVAEESPEGFASAVNRLLMDERLRVDMGRKARRLAETRLSWAVLAKELLEFYEVLLAASRRESQK